MGELTATPQLVGEFIEPLCVSPTFIGGFRLTEGGRSIETKTYLFIPISRTPSSRVPAGQVAPVATWSV